MTIDTIEKYIDELEAIKNYALVRQERDDLSQEIDELKTALDRACEEITSLRSLKANLDDGDMTLEQARLHFLHMQEAEVEERAADRFERLKANYESQMPELVHERLCAILGQPSWPEKIARLIDTEAMKKADAILQHRRNWPPWFKKLYDGEVEKRVSAGLNEEFNARVETVAETRARQKLNELITTHWPAWHRENVEPRIAELENKIRADALQLLRGPWTFTCDQCGTRSNAELTAAEIEKLLRTGQIKVACGNPDCEDKGWFSNRRHTFYMSLLDFIETHIMGG